MAASQLAISARSTEECRSFAGGAPTFRGAVCFCGARFLISIPIVAPATLWRAETEAGGLPWKNGSNSEDIPCCDSVVRDGDALRHGRRRHKPMELFQKRAFRRSGDVAASAALVLANRRRAAPLAVKSDGRRSSGLLPV